MDPQTLQPVWYLTSLIICIDLRISNFDDSPEINLGYNIQAKTRRSPTRHRSLANFMVNLMRGLIAYAHQPKKPSLGRETLTCLPA